MPTKKTAPTRQSHSGQGFRTHERIVYPAHGVGQVMGVEKQEVAGLDLEVFVITFDRTR